MVGFESALTEILDFVFAMLFTRKYSIYLMEVLWYGDAAY